MLLPRVITAVFGIPLVLILIQLGGAAFAVFVLGVVFLSLYEYGLLVRRVAPNPQSVLGAASGVALAAALMWAGPAFSAVPVVVTALVALSILREVIRSDRSLARAALSLFGVFFIAWNLSHLYLLRDLRPVGKEMVFFLFVVIWALDCGAYFVGRTFRGPKLAGAVSPGKTVAGAVGGFAAALAAAWVFRGVWLRDALSAYEALALGALIGTLAQLSDLAESVLKRSLGVKDSSNLLPGHGGVLDRFDSFLLTAPAFYYALVFKGFR